MARLTTRSDLARRAGVSPTAITKLCKTKLGPGCVGKRIDLDHPVVVAYLEGKGKDAGPTKTAGPPPERKRKPTAGRPPSEKGEESAQPPRRRGPRKGSSRSSSGADDGPAPNAAELAREVTGEEIEAYSHLSLDELVERFGTAIAFRDWLDARKKISEIREKDLKNDETEGRLIERELVRTHIFGAIEAGNRRLLGDAPKTIARRLYALAKSGAPIEEAEGVVREIMASQLKPVKATAARVLRNA